MPYLVTIGNTDSDGFADWLDMYRDHPAVHVPDVTILPTVGTFHGDREEGVAVIVWTDDRSDVAAMLAAYGIDHPDELAFGLTPLPESNLIDNPAARTAA